MDPAISQNQHEAGYYIVASPCSRWEEWIRWVAACHFLFFSFLFFDQFIFGIADGVEEAETEILYACEYFLENWTFVK
jgi:hypothetical protein